MAVCRRSSQAFGTVTLDAIANERGIAMCISRVANLWSGRKNEDNFRDLVGWSVDYIEEYRGIYRGRHIVRAHQSTR